MACAYPLLASISGVALVLVCGAVVHSDLTRRRIPNSYCIAVALLAIGWAFASTGANAGVSAGGGSGMSDLAGRFGMALVVTVPLLALFAGGIVAGGDVKLLVAMLLWVPSGSVATMLILTIFAGGIVAVALMLLHRLFQRVNAESVPYGVAIVAGAMVVLIPDLREAWAAAH